MISKADRRKTVSQWEPNPWRGSGGGPKRTTMEFINEKLQPKTAEEIAEEDRRSDANRLARERLEWSKKEAMEARAKKEKERQEWDLHVSKIIAEENARLETEEKRLADEANIFLQELASI